MKVKVISVQQPVNSESGNSLMENIAYTARVSNPGNQNNHETSEKLVKYLMKHKHWSPFEMVNVCMEVEVTRDIARQLLRHRSFSFQEFSQRYAEATDFELSECRLQDKKNRQNSLANDSEELDEWWERMQTNINKGVRSVYQDALDKGIAKEVARKILPEGLTMSRLYVNGSIRSWIHYIEVRTHPSTQKEHRELALACKEALKPYFDIDEVCK